MGTSPSLGVIIGPVGRGSGAPIKKASRSLPLSNKVLTLVGVVRSPPTIVGTTSTGVARTPTARIVAKMDKRKTLACILNNSGGKIEIGPGSGC